MFLNFTDYFSNFPENFPNFPDHFPNSLDYFPNSNILSENGPGARFLGSHFFPTIPHGQPQPIPSVFVVVDDLPYLLRGEDDDNEKNEGTGILSSSDDDDDEKRMMMKKRMTVKKRSERSFQFCKSGKCTECSFNSDCPGSRVNFS